MDTGAVIDPLPYGQVLDIQGIRLSCTQPVTFLAPRRSASIARSGVRCVRRLQGRTRLHLRPLEPIRCHAFVTESTFGLPIYRWPKQEEVFAEINTWWRQTVTPAKSSVLFAYALGKSQRLLAGLNRRSVRSTSTARSSR